MFHRNITSTDWAFKYTYLLTWMIRLEKRDLDVLIYKLSAHLETNQCGWQNAKIQTTVEYLSCTELPHDWKEKLTFPCSAWAASHFFLTLTQKCFIVLS